jgi:hypothetical protein
MSPLVQVRRDMRRWCRAELLMGHLVGRSIRLPLCGTRADSRLTQAAVDCLSDYRDIRVEVAAPTLARRRGVGAGHRVATAQSDPARLPRPMVLTPKRSPSLDWWHGVNESSTLGPGAPASRLEAPRAAERVDARAGAERGGDAPRAAARLRVARHTGETDACLGAQPGVSLLTPFRLLGTEDDGKSQGEAHYELRSRRGKAPTSTGRLGQSACTRSDSLRWRSRRLNRVPRCARRSS